MNPVEEHRWLHARLTELTHLLRDVIAWQENVNEQGVAPDAARKQHDAQLFGHFRQRAEDLAAAFEGREV